MVQPKLRSVDVRPFVDQGRSLLLLRDPVGLSDLTVVVPQALGPLLALLDGSRDVGTLRARMLVHSGLDVPEELILQLLDHLDNALLLENDHYAEVHARALDCYRSAAFRKPALAGNGYPADPGQLRQLLVRYSSDAPGYPSDGGGQNAVVGLVSPHIDYERGGRVYAQVWQAATEAARAADLAIIFGTDHNSSRSLITLTRQNYATPYGTLPTAQPVVDAIASAIGEEDAFVEEINHQHEHSIELAAVWLHHVRRGKPCQLVPILCGSLHRLMEQKARPADDPVLNAALDALRPVLGNRRVIVVAAADLAHIGPAFGDPVSVDYVRYLRLQAADEVLIQTILQGSADDFYQMIAREENRRNVCGLPPIYLALRLLNGRTSGTLAGYDRCPADTRNTSFVSICGVILRDTSAG
jgi:AmmeMemoRadiSam system protein B